MKDTIGSYLDHSVAKQRSGVMKAMGLRILHLSTFDVDSGAARGMFWLHRALRSSGIDSTILVGRKSGDDPDVQGPKTPLGRLMVRARMRLDQVPLKRYHKTSEAFWTTAWIPTDVARQVRALAPDIVHVHWIGNGFVSIEDLHEFRCPIVWTLRDMWPFTGGCHYTSGCDQFRGMCGACPQLRSSDQNDASRTIWNRKYRSWQNLDLWVVPISTWLAGCTRASALLRPYPIEVIPNGVDTERFRPAPRALHRAEWGLPEDARVVVFGALKATSDPRKGYSYLIDALARLAQTGRAKRMVVVIFGGERPVDSPDPAIEIRYVGQIDDDQRLARLYASADVAVVPSLQEAFGKTVIEAMACGTPVVAFDSAGPRDIITHRVDGYLARLFDSADLADGIAWCLESGEQSAVLAARARAKAIDKFDIATVAERYAQLYAKIAGRSPVAHDLMSS